MRLVPYTGGWGKRGRGEGMGCASCWSYCTGLFITPSLPVYCGVELAPGATAAATWPVPRGCVSGAAPRPGRLE